MIDDTPQVKWSGAWWEMVFLGFFVPVSLVGLLIYCLAAGKAFAIGVLRYRAIEIHEVHGFQSHLMMVGYACLALAAFSYGYARHHPFPSLYYDKVLALTLLAGAVSITWCSILFFF